MSLNLPPMFNPLADLSVQDPMTSLKSGYAFGSQMAADQVARDKAIADAKAAEETKAAAEAAAAARTAVLQKLQDPKATYDDYMRASVLYPDFTKGIQDAAAGMQKEQQQAVLTDSSKVVAAFRSNNPDVAIDLLQQQAYAQRKDNPQGAKFLDTLLTNAKTDPAGLKTLENLVGMQMAVLPGGKDAFDAIEKLQTVQGTNPDVTLQQQSADVDLTKAQTAEAWANAFRLQHPDKPSNLPAEALINKAVDDVGTATQYAARAENLATAIDKSTPKGGWPAGLAGKGWEAIKNVVGGQDAITALKQEYLTLRSTEAMKHLAPGQASDADVKLALEPFPTADASPAYIADYMHKVARLQAYVANYNKAKAEWVDHVGSLGSAKEDFVAGGVPVKKGMNFWDLTEKITVPNVATSTTTSATVPTTSATPTAVSFTVAVPGGKTYSFPTQEALDAFKKAANLP